ncbi:MAG TPA: phage holin family protein [Gaiellales bacterium]|jgi:predicted membrane metal-binding protein
MAEPGENQRDRSLSDLLGRLPTEVRALVRAELALARAELLAGVRRVALAAALAAAGAVLGLLALGALVAAAVLGLATVWPAWLAALVVALALVAIAGSLLLAGVAIGRRAVAPASAETLASIREDVEWVKTRARSGTT